MKTEQEIFEILNRDIQSCDCTDRHELANYIHNLVHKIEIKCPYKQCKIDSKEE